MAAFSAGYRVIAFDNRGVGRTDATDRPYTTGMTAGDALGLMDALGVDRAHVLGVSMGGARAGAGPRATGARAHGGPFEAPPCP